MGTIVKEPGKANDELSESEFHDRLLELPPSAKLIVKVLETDGPLPQGELA